MVRTHVEVVGSSLASVNFLVGVGISFLEVEITHLGPQNRLVSAVDNVLPALRGFLGIGEFSEAAAVVVVADEGGGFGEFCAVPKQAGAVEVDIAEVQRHRPSAGNALRLVQQAAGFLRLAEEMTDLRGGEQGAGDVVGRSRVTEAVQGGLGFAFEGGGFMRNGGKYGPVKRRPRQRQVVEGDGKEAEIAFRDFEGLGGAAGGFRASV